MQRIARHLLFVVVIFAAVGLQTTFAQAQALTAEEIQQLRALLAHMRVVQEAINGLAGPHVLFDGANVHVRSGSGNTHDGLMTPLGLGNLVVGYNEPRGSDESDRGGSHNLIVGSRHKYPNIGGFVAGFNNTVSGYSASVSGGRDNDATGSHASVSGGFNNEAANLYASVSGGYDNEATGAYASVSGGSENDAASQYASISGGRDNFVMGEYASISGGIHNSAKAKYTSVSGGDANEAR